MSFIFPIPEISYPDFKNFEGFLLNKFKDIKEEINPLGFFLPTEAKVGYIEEKKFLQSFFGGRAVEIPRFKITDSEVEYFNRFEDYTKKDEVRHIALWTLAALDYSFPGQLRVGKELEIPHQAMPRDGRLDVVALEGSQVLVIETKKTLEALLTENRFISQMGGYKREGLSCMKQHLNSTNLTLVLGIGGEETDLYPPNHPDCTSGQVGDRAKIFYDKINVEGIQFVSANALWCLTALQFFSGKESNVFNLLNSIFTRPNVCGLLSGGIVLNSKDGLTIERLDLSVID